MISLSLLSLPLLLLLPPGPGDDDTAQDDRLVPEVTPGHARMLAELEEIRAACRADNVYLGWAPVERLRARLDELDGDPDNANVWRAELDLCDEYLRMGSTVSAIASGERGVARIQDYVARRPKAAERLTPELAEAWYRLGTAYLRLGEERNCCLGNDPEACLLPIRGGGLHDDEEGSRVAIRCFEETLALVKINSQLGRKSRWLLNVAHMTLGTHPDGVAEEFRIGEDVFAADEPFPRFADVGAAVGLTRRGLAGGLVAEDFDLDGDLDLMTSNSDADGQLRLYLHEDGRYVERTVEAGLTGLYGGLNLVSGDVDDDGDVDVFVLRGAWLRLEGQHPNSLLRNEGDGRFVDVTFDAGLGERRHPTQTAAFADFDNDGDLDLYVGNEAMPGQDAPGELWRNEGDGTFVDVAVAAGVTNDGYAKAVTWGDYDGDGDSDLYVSNMASANRLYRNEGDGTFVDVAPELGVTGPVSGFPAWFFDYDQDGVLDIFAATYGGPRREPTLADVVGSMLGLKHRGGDLCLYRGDGAGGFTEVAAQAGLDFYTLPMGSNFGDADHDGYPDIYLGTGYPFYEGLMPNLLLRNRAGAGFADVTTAAGVGHLQKGHGIAFADVDRDGDQDLVARMGGAYPGDAYRCVLFENPGNGNRWLEVLLVGETSNRFGVGARIRVDVVEGEDERSIHRVVGTGGSFGCNPMRQLIGLGAAEEIVRLEVFWPSSGTRQVFEGVALDASVEVHEGADEIVAVERRPTPLAAE